MKIPDVVWLVNKSPYVDCLFRHVDWNPSPRQIPLDSGEVSPRTKIPLPNNPGGVLNAEYSSSDWILADKDRQLVGLGFTEDEPIAYWPRPRKPARNYTGPTRDLPITMQRGTLTRYGWAYLADNVQLPEYMRPLPYQFSTARPEVSQSLGHAGNTERQNTRIWHGSPNPESNYPPASPLKRQAAECELDEEYRVKKSKGAA